MCNIQTQSAHIWKRVTHSQFRHESRQMPTSKGLPRCTTAACFAPSFEPQQNPLFMSPAQSISGFSRIEGCEADLCQLPDTCKEEIYRITLFSCMSPKKISLESWDPAGRDRGLRRAKPISGLKPCPAHHQPSPWFTYSSQIFPAQWLWLQQQLINCT